MTTKTAVKMMMIIIIVVVVVLVVVVVVMVMMMMMMMMMMTTTTIKQVSLYTIQLRRKHVILNVQTPKKQNIPITLDINTVQRVANKYFICSIVCKENGYQLRPVAHTIQRQMNVFSNFDVFSTVHCSIDLFNLPTLMHNSLIH